MAVRRHTVPKRVRGANETEQRLLESALTLFSGKGYDGASIREIIERAGVTRPVLYYYFQNKQELFCRLVEGWLSELAEDVQRQLAAVTGLRDRLRAYVRNAFEHAERRPEVVRLILQVLFSSTYPNSAMDSNGVWERRITQIGAIMEDGLADGEINGRSPRMLAMSLCGMMDFYIMARSHNADMRLSDELADELADLFLDGALRERTGEERVGSIVEVEIG